jgi:hypothetical protein
MIYRRFMRRGKAKKKPCKHKWIQTADNEIFKLFCHFFKGNSIQDFTAERGNACQMCGKVPADDFSNLTSRPAGSI